MEVAEDVEEEEDAVEIVVEEEVEEEEIVVEDVVEVVVDVEDVWTKTHLTRISTIG